MQAPHSRPAAAHSLLRRMPVALQAVQESPEAGGAAARPPLGSALIHCNQESQAAPIERQRGAVAAAPACHPAAAMQGDGSFFWQAPAPAIASSLHELACGGVDAADLCGAKVLDWHIRRVLELHSCMWQGWTGGRQLLHGWHRQL